MTPSFTYFDPNLAASCDSALARLAGNDWSSGSDASKIRDLGGITAFKCLLVGYLVGQVTQTTSPDNVVSAEVSGDLSQPGERGDFARGLLAPLVYYYAAAALPAQPEQSGLAFVAPADTGLWPIPVIIAVTVAGSAIAIWTEQKATDLVKFFKTQNTQVAEIQRLDSKLTDTVSQHVKAEQVAKAQIPFTEAERLQLTSLRERLNQLQGQLGEPPSGSWINQIPWYAWAIGAGALVAIAGVSILSRTPLRLPPQRAA